MKEDYYYWPADLLAQYLVKEYHVHLLEMVKKVTADFEQLLSTHGTSYPLLYEVHNQYSHCTQELLSHLSREAVAILPYARRYTQELKKQRCLRKPGHYSVCHSIDRMYHEHKKIYFNRLAELMHCVDIEDSALYQSLCIALQEISVLWQELVRLENDVLFPKLVELEATLKPI